MNPLKPIIGLETAVNPIDSFIQEYGYGKDWFVEYCGDYQQQNRVMDIVNKKLYLAGEHAILNKRFTTLDKDIHIPNKIVLQYAKQLLTYATSFLIGNKITLSGNERVVEEFRKIYKTSDYDKKDFDLVHNVNKFGNAYEYVWIKPGQARKISSKIIDPADSFPVYGHEGEYVAFVEHYVSGNVSYYNVYYPDRVQKYSNAGGSLMLKNTFSNLSGLPVVYRNDNPLDSRYGRSDLEDYMTILDSLELLLTKSVISYYSFISGIPVITGQRLFDKKAYKDAEGLDRNVVGEGLQLDSDSTFKFESNEISHEAFEKLYKTLMTSLLDVASVPAVAMGKADVSNLSEISIKLMYSMASIRARVTEKYIKESMRVRFDKIRTLLEYKGITFSDEEYESLDITFTHSIPQSETDIISNLKTLREMGAMSIESVVTNSPYTSDTNSELQKLQSEIKQDTNNV
ncbi:phage portal protein [Saccharibacillus brassicae]|uniref:Phage portal protein n=1 Tax=Saccharibacillus brassicae TaxID=2583377 RepID=A0A4Y6UQ72_SACBS|nr:phage portal protein [Saccharibacillus brassicae]QDH19783.1 phage portal protein [Saccharibacillus brassicae]